MNFSDRSYLYVVQADKYFKIGVSNKPRFRTYLLDSSMFTKAELKCVIKFDNRRGAEIAEKNILCALKEFNIKGEWFDLSFESILEKFSTYGMNAIFDFREIDEINPKKRVPKGKTVINVMISDESKAILLKYQEENKHSKLDDALDMLIKEKR